MIIKLNKPIEALENIIEKIDEKIEALEEKQSAIEEKAEYYDRDLTEKEQKRYDKLQDEIEELENEKDEIENALGYLSLRNHSKKNQYCRFSEKHRAEEQRTFCYWILEYIFLRAIVVTGYRLIYLQR